MRTLVLLFLVTVASCGVIKDESIRDKREVFPELLALDVGGKSNLASESLVNSDLQRAMDAASAEAKQLANAMVGQLNGQANQIANEMVRELNNLKPNSAHTSSVSMQVMLGTVIMTAVKMLL